MNESCESLIVKYTEMTLRYLQKEYKQDNREENQLTTPLLSLVGRILAPLSVSF